MTPQMKNFYKLEKRWIGGEVITHDDDSYDDHDYDDDHDND